MRDRRGRDPSRLRVPGRAGGVRPGGRGRRDSPSSGPASAAIAALGDKLACAAGGRTGRRAGRARHARAGARRPAATSSTAIVAAAEAIGFPLLVKAAAGGGGRGMRRVDAAGGTAGRARRGLARGGGRHSATGRCTSSARSSPPVTSRSSCWVTRSGTGRGNRRAGLLAPATPPEARRGGARAGPDGGAATAAPRMAVRIGVCRRASERGDLRVPLRPRRPLLVPRGQHPSPGGAWRDRARRRAWTSCGSSSGSPRARRSPGRRSRPPSAPRRRRATRSRSASRPRIRARELRAGAGPGRLDGRCPAVRASGSTRRIEAGDASRPTTTRSSPSSWSMPATGRRRSPAAPGARRDRDRRDPDDAAVLPVRRAHPAFAQRTSSTDWVAEHWDGDRRRPRRAARRGAQLAAGLAAVGSDRGSGGASPRRRDNPGSWGPAAGGTVAGAAAVAGATAASATRWPSVTDGRTDRRRLGGRATTAASRRTASLDDGLVRGRPLAEPSDPLGGPARAGDPSAVAAPSRTRRSGRSTRSSPRRRRRSAMTSRPSARVDVRRSGRASRGRPGRLCDCADDDAQLAIETGESPTRSACDSRRRGSRSWTRTDANSRPARPSRPSRCRRRRASRRSWSTDGGSSSSSSPSAGGAP